MSICGFVNFSFIQGMKLKTLKHRRSKRQYTTASRRRGLLHIVRQRATSTYFVTVGFL